MSALVAYASSDEEVEDRNHEAVGVDDSEEANVRKQEPLKPSSVIAVNGRVDAGPSHAIPPSEGDSGGAILGPAGPPEDPDIANDITSTPQSPYSANRTRIRNLTLPIIPNLDIPPSPPGSPPPGMNEKFEHFLKLKKQGVHFNEKLARSSALKNPSLLQKLMAAAGLEEEDQYNTTLLEDLWNPKGFPPWAYKEELARSQQELTKKREAERLRAQRESIDFVPATSLGDSGRFGTTLASVGPKISKTSAAERVMAGLDREPPKPHQAGSSSLKKDPQRRVSRFDDNRSAAGSRSPKRRKRSRSR